MNEDGVIFVIRRIKDIIQRVGRSLSPAVVESVLNSMPGAEVSQDLSSLIGISADRKQACVIGVPHADFGKVPLAIVKDPKHAKGASEIRKAVRNSLGADYALEDVKSLADIGLEAWPLNQAGKITKHELETAYLDKFAS